MPTSNMKNYYDVLEVESNVNQEDIRHAYTRAKNAYSGDGIALYSLLSSDEADKVLELIEEAYNILSCPDKRGQYNKARGIDPTPQAGSSNHTSAQEEKVDTKEFEKDKLNTEGSVNKLLAQKRYGLDFKENGDFELEIEQCSDFTGEFLKKVREYKNVDIPRLSDMTKISKTFLKYIEDDDVKKMPALVYVRGFVYQYAKCLKMNPDLVSNSYIAHIKRLKGEA